MAERGRAAAFAGDRASVDALLRSHGLPPTELVRSLLADAVEERMRSRGEPFGVAVGRAAAGLVASARARR